MYVYWLLKEIVMTNPMQKAYDLGPPEDQPRGSWLGDCPKPKMTPVSLYELRRWDGADGRSNRVTGFVTSDEAVAVEWCELDSGNDYNYIRGILIHSIDDMKSAAVELEKQKAIAKLTLRERQLLNLT